MRRRAERLLTGRKKYTIRPTGSFSAWMVLAAFMLICTLLKSKGSFQLGWISWEIFLGSAPSKMVAPPSEAQDSQSSPPEAVSSSLCEWVTVKALSTPQLAETSFHAQPLGSEV